MEIRSEHIDCLQYLSTGYLLLEVMEKWMWYDNGSKKKTLGRGGLVFKYVFKHDNKCFSHDQNWNQIV